MLNILNVTASFSGLAVLKDVSLEIARGETLALIGSSGSGKTTLLRITLGLVPFDSGEVRIGDQPLSSFRQSHWAERIGYVPQDGGLFPHLSGADNVALIARRRGWDRSRIESRMEELRLLVELDREVLSHFPSEMSGGQKQRVAIMRAALMDPSVMLLDEPMGSLDPLVRRTLQDELKRIFSRLGKTVLLVTHDLSEAVYFAERLALLHEGRIVQTGTYADLVSRPSEPFVQTFIRAHRALPTIGGET